MESFKGAVEQVLEDCRSLIVQWTFNIQGGQYDVGCEADFSGASSRTSSRAARLARAEIDWRRRQKKQRAFKMEMEHSFFFWKGNRWKVLVSHFHIVPLHLPVGVFSLGSFSLCKVGVGHFAPWRRDKAVLRKNITKLTPVSSRLTFASRKKLFGEFLVGVPCKVCQEEIVAGCCRQISALKKTCHQIGRSFLSVQHTGSVKIK